jgi:hypothetical protein
MSSFYISVLKRLLWTVVSITIHWAYCFWSNMNHLQWIQVIGCNIYDIRTFPLITVYVCIRYKNVPLTMYVRIPYTYIPLTVYICIPYTCVPLTVYVCIRYTNFSLTVYVRIRYSYVPLTVYVWIRYRYTFPLRCTAYKGLYVRIITSGNGSINIARRINTPKYCLQSKALTKTIWIVTLISSSHKPKRR